MQLPSPRGDISALLLEALAGAPAPLPALPEVQFADRFGAEDLHLSLYLCYELHYRGLPGIDDRWEWEISLLALRARLEACFEQGLFEALGEPCAGPDPDEMDRALRAIEQDDDAPSLSSFVERRATLAQFIEFVVHRSAYQLKEADPHSWALPRLSGVPKAAMVEIQADEYGGGHAERIHAHLFARTMECLGLDASYGAYLDVIPGITLATVNLMSLFGLHRRWRGAIVGHLALFEMTSPIPNARYASGLRRLGFHGDATVFFDEHVEADAVHENIAATDLAGGLARQDPAVAGDILWGAQALSLLDGRWARHMLGCWEASESSLRANWSQVRRQPAGADSEGRSAAGPTDSAGLSGSAGLPGGAGVLSERA